MVNQATAEPSAQKVSETYRWMQLIIGVVAMIMIANYQYGWTLFVPEIEKTFKWTRSDIQIAFTLFVLFETWLVPVEGWFVDKYGPKLVVLVGGLLCGLGWWMTSRATSLGGLDGYYAAMVICGVGAGGVYGTCVGNALKWFPDRRGLAAGITAAGFGAGSAFTVAPIQNMIKSDGFQHTFLYFGIGQGICLVLLAFLMAAPQAGQTPTVAASTSATQTRRQFAPSEVIGLDTSWVLGVFLVLACFLAVYYLGVASMLPPSLKLWVPLSLAAFIFIGGIITTSLNGQPVFMVLYLMFVLVSAGGLMATASLAPIAKDYKIAEIPVTIGWTLPALTFALSIDRILNGFTRPFFGWVSDQIGRELTMFIAFGIEGVGIYLLYLYGKDPFWFVVLSGLVFFAWGEIFSLFPSTCTDTFGSKFATTNAGLLYSAKGTSALLVPYGSFLQKSTGSWDTVFIIAAGANILAAVLALAVLKPWRARVLRQAEA